MEHSWYTMHRTIRAIRRLPAALLVPRRVAHAHSGAHSYVFVEVGDAFITGNVQFPITDLNEVLSLSIPQDEVGALAAMHERRDVIEGYAADRLSIGTGAASWAVAFTGHRVLERKAGSYAILDYRITSDLDPVPCRFTVTYDGIIHAKPHHEALIIVKTSSGIGPFRSVREQQLACTGGHTVQDVSLAEDSAWRDVTGAAEFITAGARKLLRTARKRLRR